MVFIVIQLVLEQAHLERFISSPWLAFLRETTREPKILHIKETKKWNICTKYFGVWKKKGNIFGSFWENIYDIWCINNIGNLELNLLMGRKRKERDHIWEAFRKSRPAAMMQCGSLLIKDQLAADLKKTQYCTNKIQIQTSINYHFPCLTRINFLLGMWCQNLVALFINW